MDALGLMLGCLGIVIFAVFTALAFIFWYTAKDL